MHCRKIRTSTGTHKTCMTGRIHKLDMRWVLWEAEPSQATFGASHSGIEKLASKYGAGRTFVPRSDDARKMRHSTRLGIQCTVRRTVRRGVVVGFADDVGAEAYAFTCTEARVPGDKRHAPARSESPTTT